MEEKAPDRIIYESFCIPDYILHFLVDLTTPRSGEEVLGIGLIDPETLASALEKRDSDIALEYVRGHPTSEELGRLTPLWYVFGTLC